MLDNLDNGKEEKNKRVNNTGEESGKSSTTWGCPKTGESCREDMCPRNTGSLHGIDIKLGKSFVKMVTDGSEVSRNSKESRTGKCSEEEEEEEEKVCAVSRQVSRLTGSSCRALKCAVSTLHRLDDFNMEKIGSGFFSEVFKVTHKVTGKVMVLKMNLLRSNRPNMLKEVQLMNQLKHRNILNFLGVCVHEGQLHALTEYINGGSLEQLIQSWNIELPYLMRQELALDIARGMEYLHGKGVFHRDLTSKNVLIKKSDCKSMMAVVGDFGLAAKIPDAKCKYRLPTVGSAYWMSPECLKGQWYNEKSDIFSYGIVLCEMIARIEADPDVLPRTDNFGLDYLAFSELCGPCPPHFLKLAFSCSTFEPKSRPSFCEIVKTLEKLIPEYEELLKKDEQMEMANGGSLDNLADVSDKTTITARSEEVINKYVANTKDMQHRKLHHRRSLSEDVANFLFPRHTAPSDKARHHILTTTKHVNCEILANPKHIGESMFQVDPHYKPRLSGEKGSRSNPFLALSQFRGAKKIVGSQNLPFSKDGQTPTENSDPYFGSNDLFSSCFELPSPFYGITPPSSPVTGNSFDEKSRRNLCWKCFQEGCDVKYENGETCHADESVCETKIRFTRRLSSTDGFKSANKKETLNSSPKCVKHCKHQKFSRSNGNQTEVNYSEICTFCLRNANEKNGCERWNLSGDPPPSSRNENRSSKCGLSMSLPNSPTPPRKSASKDKVFAQKETEKQLKYPSVVEPSIKPKKLIKSRTDPLLKNCSREFIREKSDSPKTESGEKEQESSFNSYRNLSDKVVFQENPPPEAKETGKCEKNRGMNEGELNPLATMRISSSSSNLLECTADYSFLTASIPQLKRRGSCESGFFSCIGEDHITCNEALPSCDYVLQTSRQKHLDNSSATLSSSSAASSLFLLDDSLSTTTVSSLRSGSGDFNDLDDLPSKFTHHSILFSGKRSSSIYTDSSEDVSSLGDLDDRNQSRYQSQQISKIVEYFERKQTSGINSRSEGSVKQKRNHNVEFQKNIERFDSSKTCTNDKIKWEGLEGKFKKSGMGLTQKREESSRSKVDLGNSKGKRSGVENCYLHDLPKRLEGGSISDAIRKSKIELLRKSLEKGTLQVPGINPCLSSNSGVSGCSNDKNSARPLATRLMICEGAVKSKLQLFDKK